MKKVDIIKLRLKGVPTDEIKQLMELETLAEDADQEEEELTPPPAEEEKEEEKEEVTPADDISKALEEARAQITKLQEEKEALQKKKVREDISGADNTKDDQDIFNDCVRSFM